MMSDKAKKYYDALDDLLDKPIAYNPAFKKITLRTSAAVWLSQVWYWSKRTSNKDGWFWKSARECKEETGLTDNEQKSARTLCLELGIIEEDLRGVPATMHYRLIKPKVYELLGIQFPTEQESTEFPTPSGTGSPKRGKQVSHRARNINKESENTSVTTHGITEGKPRPPKANDFPSNVLYRSVTERYPAKANWHTVQGFITDVEKRLSRSATRDDLFPYYEAWCGFGWREDSIHWLEYAVRGVMPAKFTGNTKQSSTPTTPAPDNFMAELAADRAALRAEVRR